MGWTTPYDSTTGEVITETIWDTYLTNNLRYLKGLDGAVTLSDGLNLGANELTINSLETVGVDGIVNKEQVEDHTHADAANCGTIAHSVLTGTPFKLKAETRANNADSGDVVYTGYGFTAKALIILAAGGDSSAHSTGLADASLYGCLVATELASSRNIVTTSVIYVYNSGATTGQSAILKSISSDGFTLTWTKIGNPSAGTINILVLAFS